MLLFLTMVFDSFYQKQIKKKKNLNWNWIHSEKVAIFHTRTLHWSEPISLTTAGHLLTLWKHCQMTQHPPPWTSHCETCWEQTVCTERSFCPRAAIRCSSSRRVGEPGEKVGPTLVGPTAAAHRCCLIKHLRLNAELPVGRACKIRR